MSESVGSEVVSAMVGGMFSASALYPLEVLKTRMQAEGKSKKSLGNDIGDSESGEEKKGCRLDVATDDDDDDGDDDDDDKYRVAASEGMIPYASLMYSNEGGFPGAFYSGVATSAVQSATEKALYFFSYTFLKNGYASLSGDPNIGTASNLLLGCLAEWSHLPVTLPIDCLTTAIQTDDRNRGAFVLLGSMLSEKGVGGFYKGIEAYTVLCLKPAIQYTVYEQVKKAVLLARIQNNSSNRKSQSLAAPEAFFLGMFARVVATMLTYPYLRAKVLLQSTYGNCKPEDKPTIPDMIAEQLKQGGFGALYQGIGPELTRGVFSAALMMMVKERIGVAVKALIDGGADAGGGEGAQNRRTKA